MFCFHFPGTGNLLYDCIKSDSPKHKNEANKTKTKSKKQTNNKEKTQNKTKSLPMSLITTTKRLIKVMNFYIWTVSTTSPILILQKDWHFVKIKEARQPLHFVTNRLFLVIYSPLYEISIIIMFSASPVLTQHMYPASSLLFRIQLWTKQATALPSALPVLMEAPTSLAGWCRSSYSAFTKIIRLFKAFLWTKQESNS